MLDLRPLRHFTAIVELGSLSRAATHVGVAQPALSHQMAALEADLGVKLLHRGPRGATATEAGRTLYRHAQVLLRQLDQARRAVNVSGEGVSGTVSVGLSVTTAEILSLPLLRRLQAEHPGIRLELVALPRRLLGEMLTNGRLDIALLFDQPPVRSLTVQALAIEEIFFVSQKSGDAESASEGITFAEIARHPLLMPCRPHATRMLLESMMTQAGIQYNVVAEIDSVPSMLEAVEAGLAATVLPWSAVYRQALQGRISVRPFAVPITREIAMCRSETVPLSAPVMATWTAILPCLQELVGARAWKGLRLLDPSAETRAVVPGSASVA
jgi:LysR family transcriptional regulator, nitrogen assimilation regulatory protein